MPPFDEFFAYNFEGSVSGERQVLQQLLQIRPGFLGVHALTVVMAVQQHDCGTAQREATLAFAAACVHDRPEALRRIGQMAIAYALLGDRDNTVAQLGKSANAREGQILYLKYDPFFDAVRADPRYVALEKRIGLI